MLRSGARSLILVTSIVSFWVTNTPGTGAQTRAAYQIVYRVILGGMVVFSTTSFFKALGYKNANPGAKIEKSKVRKEANDDQ